jgi:phosphoglycerate dehydrogenase-like enzyme
MVFGCIRAQEPARKSGVRDVASAVGHNGTRRRAVAGSQHPPGHHQDEFMPRLLILLTLPGNIGQRYRTMILERFPELAVDLTAKREEYDELVRSADMLITFGPMVRNLNLDLKHGARLKWIQGLGTGMDGIIDHPSLRSDTVVTSMKGIHGPPVSEAAIAGMLALGRDIPRFVRNQDSKTWERWPARLLDRKTVGILGVGVIAEALAPKCKALGMKVVGITSAKRELAGFDEMRSVDELVKVVPQLDFLVLLTPYSAATRHIIDAKVLAAMKPRSYLINLARGGIVDEDALVEALEQGKLGGAALDVFNEEPLPITSKLWSFKNVIVTTHQGGFCDIYPELAMPIIEHNMRCFLAGDLKRMVNVVQATA